MRIPVLAALCLITVGLTGCGDDDPSPGTATSRPAGAQVGEWWVHGPTIQGSR